MASDSGADDAELRERVKQLEETVAEQQATSESRGQPTASRRGVLAALTGVAGAGALGAYSQRGAAQAAGQVGTASEPVDVFANAMDADTVEASQLTPTTGRSRPLWSTEHKTVNVPADYSTIQGAIDDCPVILRHEYKINVDDGDYSGEDLFIPTVIASELANDGNGEQLLFIEGNITTPSNVQIGSIYVQGCYGKTTPLIEGFAVNNDSPHSPESGHPVVVYGSDGAAIRHITPASGYSPAVGFLAYESNTEIRSWEGMDCSGTVVAAKRNSQVMANDIQGTGGQFGLSATENSQIGVNGSNTPNGGTRQLQGGVIVNQEDDVYRLGNASVGAVDEMSYDGGSQTMSSGAFEKTVWDGTRKNQLGGADVTNNEFVVQSDGTYRLEAMNRTVDALDLLVYEWRKNGSQIAPRKELSNISSGDTIQTQTVTTTAVKGDTISLYMRGDTSDSSDWSRDGNNLFNYMRIAPV